nr:hypothetical protein [uncultured Pedobacter sp.]
MIDLFVEFTDQIFREGYAEQLAESNLQRYFAELDDFLNTYN